MSEAYTKALDWHAASTMNGRAFDIGAADGTNVALVHGPEQGGAECFSSHASLIAAAPNLLAALKVAVATIEDYLAYRHDGDPHTEDARLMGEMDVNEFGSDGRLEAALAAIAKAEARP